jgi:hypothetical protein
MYVRAHFLLLTVAGAILVGCQKKLPEPIRRMNSRPAGINREKVVEWSLSVNGVPFEGQHHTLKRGAEVAIMGKLKPKENAVPLDTYPGMSIVLRPIDEPADKDWTAHGLPNAKMELEAPILGGKINGTPPLNAEYVPPGEYNARLYFRIVDPGRGKSTADMLATATVTVVP